MIVAQVFNEQNIVYFPKNFAKSTKANFIYLTKWLLFTFFKRVPKKDLKNRYKVKNGSMSLCALKRQLLRFLS